MRGQRASDDETTMVAGARIERLSLNDVATLASDRGPAPFNIAALLVIEGGSELPFELVRGTLERRLSAVPRMRQRLRVLPPGLGRPIWVDDSSFDIRNHVAELVASPADGPAERGRALLDAAGDLACEPLPRSRPLWRAGWVPGLDEGRAAMVIVLHHVVADGLGGLAALAALTDPPPGTDPHERAQPPYGPDDMREVGTRREESGGREHLGGRSVPSFGALAADAWGSRVRALMCTHSALSRTRSGLRELGLTAQAPRLVTPTALNRPTGRRRAISLAKVPLRAVIDTAHAHGATVNDVVLAAVGGALAAALARRGEAPQELVASVPVSARRVTTATRLGNDTGVRPLAIPTHADPYQRLELVARSSRLAAARAEGGRAASAAPLLAVFRGLARVGLLGWFISHQRLVHTFVTNVRGPADPLHLLGHPVVEIVPVAISPGNVGVTFDVLSYAGQLVVTVVADPVLVPDHEQVADDLTADLATLTQKRA